MKRFTFLLVIIFIVSCWIWGFGHPLPALCQTTHSLQVLSIKGRFLSLKGKSIHEYDYLEPGHKYRLLPKAKVHISTLDGKNTYVAVGPGILIFDSKGSISLNGKILKPKAHKSLLQDVTATKIPSHELAGLPLRGIQVIARTPEGNKIPLYRNSYALVVGNGNYTKGWDPLPGAIQDVKDVAKALEKKGFKVTLKADLTKDVFNRAFWKFCHKYGKNKDNRLLFYYAGHGHTQEMATGEDLGYLVMVDAPVPEKDPMGFSLSSVDMQIVVTQAKLIKARHVLFMFDSCFSGSILNLRERVVPQNISESIRLPVRQFITAGRANESVPDHSVFKQAFLDLLEGRDREPIPDGYITGEELGLYLKCKVPEYNPTQHPQFGKIRDPKLDKGDFLFTLQVSSQPSTKISTAQPPPSEPVGIGDYDKIIQDRRAKKKWAQWQLSMEEDFRKATKYDQSDELTSGEKSEIWDNFLSSYGGDNPYSIKDEGLRTRAKEKQKHWKEHKANVAKVLPKPKYSPPVSTDSKHKEVDTEERYIALGAGVVRDQKTGLEWLTGYGWQMTWDKTKPWIENLSLILGGGWRMPTIDELKSLYEEGSGPRNITSLLTTTSWYIWSGEGKSPERALAFNIRYGREESKPYTAQVFAVRKGKSLLETYGPKANKPLHSQEPPTVIHSQKAEIETLPNTVKVRVGDLRRDVESIYGEPSSIEVLPRYNPPVMRKIMYKDLGLNFNFFRNLLWGIEVNTPFKGKFFGVQIGDFVSQAIALYGRKHTGSSPFSKGPPHSYRWYNILPKCTLKVYVMNSRNCKEDENPIIGFEFSDSSKRGTWLPSRLFPSGN